MTSYFRMDNTEGFSADDLRLLNERVEVVLHLWQSNPESETYADEVKTACGLVSDAWPLAPAIE